MKKRCALIGCLMVLLCVNWKIASGQLANRGATLFVNENALFHINGDLTHYDGLIANRNLLSLTGNWVNNAGDVFDLLTVGTVVLSGNDQLIGGSRSTAFANLRLTQGIARLGVNTTVAGLHLADAELFTSGYKMHVSSPSVNSVTRNRGFVSSADGGGLKRELSSSENYLFPLGGVNDPSSYRPIHLSSDKAVALTASYEQPLTRMPGYDETAFADGYDFINRKYFYRIDGDPGTARINMEILYNRKEESAADAIIHWDPVLAGVKLLDGTTSETGNFGDGLDGRLSVKGLQQITPGMFILARTRALPVPLGAANVFSPNNDGVNDRWVIKGIGGYPENELKIFNRWGAEIFTGKNLKDKDGWDGGDHSDGTYFYILKVGIPGAGSEVIKGYVTIIR